MDIEEVRTTDILDAAAQSLSPSSRKLLRTLTILRNVAIVLLILATLSAIAFWKINLKTSP